MATKGAGNEQDPGFAMAASLADADLLTEVARGWDLDFRQLDSGRIDARLAHVAAGPVLLTECAMSRRIEQHGAAPPGFRTIAIPLVDDMQVRWRGEDHDGTKLMLFHPGGDLDSVSDSRFHVVTVSVAEEHLLELAEQRGSRIVDHFERGSGVVACPRQAQLRLRGMVSRLMDWAVSRPQATGEAEFRAALEDELVGELLDTLGSAATVSGRPMAKRRSRTLRLALDLIKDHAEDPISIAELERRSGASTRTLRYAFQEAFGVSPKQYLQAHRLNQVRRQLRRARPEETTVSAAANAWGFWHMGQFASDYRRQFGELPSATLAGTAG